MALLCSVGVAQAAECSEGDKIADACDGVTYEGCCANGQLQWCEVDDTDASEALCMLDCIPGGAQCGWNPDSSFYWCGETADPDPSGTFPQYCAGCTPDCDGKACGPDGCGGSCGDCVAGEMCYPDGTCAVCTPDCDGKVCGSDGCEGTCGDCLEGESCMADGSACVVGGPDSCAGLCGGQAESGCWCDATCFGYGDCCEDICDFCADDFPAIEPDGCGECIPDCEGMVCGSDGCGGTCGECAENSVCSDTGDACLPCTCDGKVCGEDLCGTSCGECAENTYCSEAGDEVIACTCDGKVCGADECGNPCGTCTDGKACDGAGQCVDIPADCIAKEEPGCPGCACEACVCAMDSWCCDNAWDDLCVEMCVLDCEGPAECADMCLPDCEGLECGDDGCGGTCGTCGEVDVCGPDGMCCTPDCEGKECGDDGCGGVCAECAPGFLCDDTFVCFDTTAIDGNTCENPFVVDALPYEATGDTTTATNNFFFEADQCSGVSGARGGASNDHVYKFTTEVDGIYAAHLVADFDSTLYVLTDCHSTADESCLSADDLSTGAEETVGGPLPAGTTVYVVVDGWHNTSNLSGTYTIVFDAPCIQDCDGKTCGDDGCGYSCGECEGEDVCYEDGTCGPCIPDCDGKICGGDDCGGTCGECPGGEACNADGTACIATADGSCAGVCGSNPADESCYCDDMCFGYGDCCPDICDFCGDMFPDPAPGGCGECTPDCTDLVCGNDGCGGSCGECPDGQTCNATGTLCIEGTPPTTCDEVHGEVGCCATELDAVFWFEGGAVAGEIGGCGGNPCGWDPENNWYSCGGEGFTGADPSGTYPLECGLPNPVPEDCVEVEVGSCVGMCGGQSADGSCYCDEMCAGYGDCCADYCDACGDVYPENCGPCTPDCAGKICGADGCGGFCGTCPEGLGCSADGTECLEVGSCADVCGTGPADESCFCDDLCNEYGDCCPDYCDECADMYPEFCGGCTPDCAGKECGFDGCDATCGTCETGEMCADFMCVDAGCATADDCATGYDCVDGVCVSVCTPDCAGKDCGSDGCEGVCGTCGADETCVAGACIADGCMTDDDCLDDEDCVDGECVPAACEPECTDKNCGFDGCDGTCGTCGADMICSEGVCVAAGCSPTAPCPAGFECIDTTCVSLCTPDCADKDCGFDGCDGTCGTCAAGEVCNAAQQCEPVCVPDCTDKDCGTDGCGGSCGTCAADETCNAAQQCEAAVCVPDCAGKTCGPDGCEGVCGTCGASEQCVDGACQAVVDPPDADAGPTGDTTTESDTGVIPNDVGPTPDTVVPGDNGVVADTGTTPTPSPKKKSDCSASGDGNALPLGLTFLMLFALVAVRRRSA